MDVWEKTMEKNVNLKAVIYYDCAEDELKRRLLKRGETSGRSDDNEESIVKRLKVFNDHTRPVLEHYDKLGKLKKIDANRTIEAITADTEAMLDSIGVFPQ